MHTNVVKIKEWTASNVAATVSNHSKRCWSSRSSVSLSSMGSVQIFHWALSCLWGVVQTSVNLKALDAYDDLNNCKIGISLFCKGLRKQMT